MDPLGQGGDDGDFADRLGEHLGIIRALARAYTETAEDREDLVQEICLQLWRAFPSFAGKSKFSTWMYRVALNTAISTLRKRRRAPRSEALYDGIPAPIRAEDGRFEILASALRRLSDADRALLLLWLEELSYEEMANVLGVSKSAVSVRLTRAKERLRESVSLIESGGDAHG